MRRVLHLPHLSGCIIPSASNSRPDWRTVETVTPVQRANWGSDWNWMSAVTGGGGGLKSVGGWCHSWRPRCRNAQSALPTPRAYKAAVALSPPLIGIRWGGGGIFRNAAADKAAACFHFLSFDGRRETTHISL